MAYSSLVSLEKTISQILDNGRYSMSPHEKKRIISLDKYAVLFLAFLQDFPEHAKKVEARMRDRAAEAEDIIEWMMTEQIRHRFRYTKWIADLRAIKFEFQLKKVRDEMDSIAEEMAEIKNCSSAGLVNDAKLDHSLKSTSSPSSSSPRIADSGKTKMVGLDEDLIEILDRLCGNSSQLQILPIFGMGGIGKTTLARNAYDNRLTAEHFHVRAWVAVSQDYTERRILSDLFDATSELDRKQGNESLAEAPELSDGEMEEKVYRALIGRRFLIVMDDMWNTKALDYVKTFLPHNTNGSRVMLTTRLANVAAYANSSTPFLEMRLMDEDRSWLLLKQKISPHFQNHIPRELENIGKEIARSCGGLPLAIVVVAGLLSSTSATDQTSSWKEIAGNVRSSLAATGDDERIEKILSLSYNHLPHHMRPCFLYMGGFPEDHEIKATSLYRLWIAEGFIVASRSLEDTAEEYLESLVERSLVVVVQRKSNGKIKSCNLHDLVREMCVRISEHDKFLVHVTGRLAGKKKAKGQRRISVSRSDVTHFANTFSLNTRTIIYFQDTLSSFGSLRLLRVLDVLRARYRSRLVPDQFFELFHLRYLAFCYEEPIPRAISNLQSLETLIIRTSLYRPLPHQIWKMPQLRHLVISGCRLLIPNNVPSTSLSLQNLQTLGKVKNLTCSVSILSRLPNLKKLRLTFFRGSGDLLLRNLVHLSRLEKLQLELETDWPDSGNNHLVVPNSLKKLTLIGWGRFKPHLIVGLPGIAQPFPNLQVLKLIKFGFGQPHWTTLDFPQLKYLLLDGLNIVQWNIPSSHFPRLKALVIRACWRLVRIPEEVGEIPTLELIELKLCLKSMAESARDMQEEKRSYGDDVFQVRCIDCEDMNELKEVDFTRSLESVRKPKQVMQKPKLNRRQRKGIGPFPEPYLVSDSREAELKIVDYKDAEFEL